MKTSWFGMAVAAFAALGATAALAADLPTRKEAPVPYIAPFSWTGFYIGANAGVIWGMGSQDITGSPDYLDLGSLYPGLTPYGLNGSYPLNMIGGGQAGYNYQFGAWVVGIETDFDGTTLNNSASYAGSNSHFLGGKGLTTSVNSDLNWIGTTRLRLGFTPVDKALLYATGGVAYGGGSISSSVALSGEPEYWSGSTNTAHVGWTVGAGAELAVTNNIIIRGEYLYYNLGNADVTAYGNTAAVDFDSGVYLTTRTNIEGSNARIGVDYEF